MDKDKRRTIWQIGDYRTLPLSIVTGLTLETIPALGSGKVQPTYLEPDYNPFPLQYSRECLTQAAEDSDFALRAVCAWTDHFAKLGYYLQFKDDIDADKFKRFHSHTELVTTIIDGRLGIDCEPLWETFEWLIKFKFAQEAYRRDEDREANYEKHVIDLDRVESQHSERMKAARVIQRAVEQIKVLSCDWTRLPGLKLSRKESKTGRVSLFYSYSHGDELLRDELEKHLTALQRQGHVDQWHDRRIGPGEDWRGQIDQHLLEADIILLLISPDFIACDYCYDIEMEQALKRHNAGEARVVPVFLRSCDWEGCPFGSIQGLPKDAKPVTTWSDRDVAFTDVSKGIRRAIQGINESRKKPRE